MATIRPSSDLRNRYNEISNFCHRNNEPVFITKNGVGDLVVLSNEAYEQLCGKRRACIPYPVQPAGMAKFDLENSSGCLW